MADLVSPTGRIVSIADADVPKALAQRYRLPTQEEVDAKAREEEYGGLGGAAVAFGTNLELKNPFSPTGQLASAAFRASADLEQYFDIGDDPLRGLREDLVKYREENPIAAGAGAIVPGVAAGIASGGATVGASVGRAALLGAVEGAAFGAHDEITEAAIKNQQLKGEQLFASVGLGAALGGVFSGGSSAGGALARRLARPSVDAVEKVAAGALGDVAPGVARSWVDGAVEKLDPIVSVASGVERGTVASLASKEARHLAVNAPKIIAEEKEVFYNALTRAAHVENLIAAQFKGGFKADQVGRLMKAGNEGAQLDAARLAVAELRSALKEMAGRPSEFKGGGWLTGKDGLLAQIDDLENTVLSRTPWSGDDMASFARDTFMRLDTIKRTIGKRAMKFANRGADELAENERHSWRTLQGMYEDKLLPLLENGSLWGDAARAQQAINAPWKLLLNIKRGQGITRGTDALFTFKTSGEWRGARRIIDKRKTDSFYDTLTNPADSDALKSLDEWSLASENFVKTARAHLDLDPAIATQADEFAKHLADIKMSRDKVVKAVTHAEQLKKLEAADGKGGILASAAGFVLGSGSLGPAGAAAALGYGALRGFGGHMRRLQALEQFAGSVDSVVARKVAGVFAGAARRTGSAARGGAISALPQARRDLHAEYERKSKNVRAVTPAVVAQRTQRALGPLGDAAPATVQSATNAALRAHLFLTSKLPPMLPSAMGREPKATTTEARKFIAAVRAVEDPSSLLDDLLDGRLSRDAVEAVKTVYPDLYADIRQRVLTKMVDAGAKGKELPYSQRVQIGILLDAATDPTMSPAFMNAVAGGYAAMPAQQRSGPAGGGTKAPKLAAAMRAGSEELADGE